MLNNAPFCWFKIGGKKHYCFPDNLQVLDNPRQTDTHMHTHRPKGCVELAFLAESSENISIKQKNLFV